MTNIFIYLMYARKYTWVKKNGCFESYPFTSGWDVWVFFKEWVDSISVKYRVLWEKRVSQNADTVCFLILTYCQNLQPLTPSLALSSGSVVEQEDDEAGHIDQDIVKGEGLKVLLRRLESTPQDYRNQMWSSISTNAINKYFKYRAYRLRCASTALDRNDEGTSPTPPPPLLQELEVEDISDDERGSSGVVGLSITKTQSPVSLDHENGYQNIGTNLNESNILDDMSYRLGNLFFGYWRENKEYISSEKTLSLLKMHMAFLDLAAIKIDDVNALLSRHLRDLGDIYNSKSKESVQQLVLEGDVKRCIFAHDICLWARQESNKHSLCVEGMWNFNTILNSEATTCKIKIEGVQNPRTLDKKLKNEIKSILNTSSLEYVVLGIADTQDWCERLHLRLSEMCLSQKLNVRTKSTMSLEANTTTIIDATTKGGKQKSLKDPFDKMGHHLKVMKTKFEELGRLDVYERVYSWWEEGIIKENI